MKKLQKNIYIGIGILLVFVLIFSMFNTSGAIIDTSLAKVQDTYCKDVNTVVNSPIYQCKSTTGNTFYCVDTKQVTCQATYQNTIWNSCSKVSSCSGTTTSTAKTFSTSTSLQNNCYNNANAICSLSSSLSGYVKATSLNLKNINCGYSLGGSYYEVDVNAYCYVKDCQSNGGSCKTTSSFTGYYLNSNFACPNGEYCFFKSTSTTPVTTTPTITTNKYQVDCSSLPFIPTGSPNYCFKISNQNVCLDSAKTELFNNIQTIKYPTVVLDLKTGLPQIYMQTKTISSDITQLKQQSFVVQGGAIYGACDNYNCDLYTELQDTTASFIQCPTGQTCQSNGLCGTASTGGIALECSSNFMRCDSSNNIYQCNNGKYVLQQNCPNGCEQIENTNFYRCKLSYKYYCRSNQGVGVCSWKETSTPNTSPNCFETEEECKESFQLACLSVDKETCTVRNGECLTGELLSYNSDNINLAIDQCTKQKVQQSCGSDSDCKDSFECTIDKCEKSLLSSVCSNKLDMECVDSEKDREICKANPFMSYNKYTDKSGGYICSFLGIGCSVETEYKCELSLWVWIIGSILGIFILFLIYKIAKKKRWI